MLSSLYIQVQHLWFYVVVYCGMVDNFYFWYCVEILIFCHESTDSLAEVTDLYADIPQEGAARPSSHDHDFSGYTLATQIFMANHDQIKWAPTSLCENPSISLTKETVPDLRDLVVM